MSLNVTGASAANLGSVFSPSTTSSAGVARGKSDLDTAFAAFLKVAKETPVERIKDAVLKAHGMTSDQFNAMPGGPAKDGILKEIQETIKKALASNRGGTASIALV
jgi:hypothetical protein